ncbi:MAG: Hsp20/alpha crystallin family protein [Sumerlaeia bacterium]
MTPIDPFRDFNILRKELNQLFSPTVEAPQKNAFLPLYGARTYPYLNIQDLPNELVVEALAPGLDPEKIDVTVHQNKLSIRGEKQAVSDQLKPEDWHRNERGTGRFLRTFNLPASVNSDAVSASYKNGILTINLPKREDAKPKQISVKVA